MVAASLRVGLVGVGRWGSKIARVLERLPGAKLAALCDTRFAAHASEAAVALWPEARDSYPCHSQIEPLLADPSIDALVIAAPSDLHHPMAARALRARKHVFVEKPLALSIETAHELAELADTSGSVLMVGHILHYHPALARCFELIEGGKLGRPLAFLSERKNSGDVAQGDVWWALGPHDVSLSRRVFRHDPHDVRARSHGETVSAVLRFSEGVAALRLAQGESSRVRRMLIVGTRNSVFFEEASGGARLELTQTTPAVHAVLRSRVPDEWRWEELGAALPAPVSLSVSGDEPLARELAHFVACVRNRQCPLTDVAEGNAVTRAMVAGQKSLRLGGRAVAVETERGRRTAFTAGSFGVGLS